MHVPIAMHNGSSLLVIINIVGKFPSDTIFFAKYTTLILCIKASDSPFSVIWYMPGYLHEVVFFSSGSWWQCCLQCTFTVI